MADLQGKKLLVLGAMRSACEFIGTAQEMGIYTIVTDSNEDWDVAYGKKIADEAWQISWSDIDALEKMCREKSVDGVVAGHSEKKIDCAFRLCQRLGLPFYASNRRQLEIMSDKALFKSVCREYGVPVVEEYDYTNAAMEDFNEVEFPVIVKPVDNGGSVGISVCRTKEELMAGIQHALDNSGSRKIIIEKYMTGDEAVIYYTFQDGKPMLTAMCDRYTNKEQDGAAQLPTSYIFPSRHIGRYISETDQTVKKMFRGLGIKNGVMFLQCFIDKDGGVRIYEPGFRLAGAAEYHVVGAISGVDTRKCLINFALTGKMADYDLEKKIDPMFRKWGCKLSPLVKEGKIGKIMGVEQISSMPEVVAVVPCYQEGDKVSGYGTLDQVVCRIYLVAETKELLKEAIDKVYDVYRVIDENNNSMLLGQFDTGLITKNY